MTPTETTEASGENTNGDLKYVNVDTTEDYSTFSRIKWTNVMGMLYIHITFLYTLVTITQYHWQTVALNLTYGYILNIVGITTGAHRLWSHHSYKAKLPLRIFIMLANSGACQNSIFDWTRDHRTHHKYTETNADPYNSKRGLFFSHIGWLLVRKHPDVVKKGVNIPLGDLYQDPVVVFQRKYYVPLALTFGFIIPTLIPWLCLNESFLSSYIVCIFRYCLSLNITWTVNSLAHKYGSKPYDRTAGATNNRLVAFIAAGEGFHNYHHAFPQDYATSEFGMKCNLTTVFINSMALIGLAYDRRSVSKGAIEARQKRTGKYSNVLAEGRTDLKAS